MIADALLPSLDELFPPAAGLSDGGKATWVSIVHPWWIGSCRYVYACERRLVEDGFADLELGGEG